MSFIGFIVSMFWSCSDQKLSADMSTLLSTSHDGMERQYGMFFPSQYDGSTAMPLVVNIHGGCMDPLSQMAAMNMRDLAEAHGFILVYPQGTPQEGMEDCLIWNSGPYGAGTENKSTADDLGFFTLLIDELKTNYMIDADRVYATGFSNGGFMTYALACYQSETFAAVAPVAGMMTGESMNLESTHPCTPTHPMPVIHFHGTADSSVPIDAGEAAVNFWVEQNSTTQSSTNTIDDDGQTIEHYSYTSGDQGAAVEYYKIMDGYHETFDGINVSNNNSLELIWTFFDQYDINGLRE